MIHTLSGNQLRKWLLNITLRPSGWKQRPNVSLHFLFLKSRRFGIILFTIMITYDVVYLPLPTLRFE